jgi:cytochrome c
MNLEFNKIAASILVAGIVAMTCGTIAKAMYLGEDAHPKSAKGEHAEEKRGYKIEVAEVAGGGAAPAAAVINIPELLSKADAAQGEKVAKVCLTCHSFEKNGANKVGPNLYGFVGGKKAHISGFAYSKVLTEMAAKGDVWDIENTWAFLNAPQKYAKGTKMSFAGVKKPEDLAALIVYLNKNSDKPVALPAAK